LIAWASIVDLATDRRLAVWTDDPVLRAVVRQSGIPATSTPAVLHYLADQRIITAEQHENAICVLIKAHIGDMPFNEHRLLELAEDEDSTSGSVAAALGRPAAWTDTPRTAALFGRLIGLAQSHRPATVPGWPYNAL